jgi:hypothetical protein
MVGMGIIEEGPLKFVTRALRGKQRRLNIVCVILVRLNMDAFVDKWWCGEMWCGAVWCGR